MIPRNRAGRSRYVHHVVHHAVRPGPASLANLLAGFRVRGQIATPSQRWLADELGVTVRTIYRWTKELRDAGQLAVHHHRAHHDPHDGRWRRKTNRYTCQFSTRPTMKREKPQVSPTGHLCPVDQPSGVGTTPADPVPVAGDGSGILAPTRPEWLDSGETAAEWVLRKMGRP